jgi:septal ring factor EnvC (AmiA/AmiB activator)
VADDKPKYFETSPEFADLVRRAYENDDPEEIEEHINDLIAREVASARSVSQMTIDSMENAAAALEKKLDEAESDIEWLNAELKEEQERAAELEQREVAYVERIKELTP